MNNFSTIHSVGQPNWPNTTSNNTPVVSSYSVSSTQGVAPTGGSSAVASDPRIQGLKALYGETAIPLQAVNNSLTMKGDTAYQLGNYDGKPVSFVFSNGEVETTAMKPVHYDFATGKASNLFPGNIASSFGSQGVLDSMNAKTDFLSTLFQMASGKISIDLFNKQLAPKVAGGMPTITLQNGLNQLGIDTTQPFSINGKTYHVKGGTLISN